MTILRKFWGSSENSEDEDPQKILRIFKESEDEDPQKKLMIPKENLKAPPKISRVPQ